MFDFSKTFAHKKGLIAALRKANIDPATVMLVADEQGRWLADEKFEATETELAAQTIRPTNEEVAPAPAPVAKEKPASKGAVAKGSTAKSSKIPAVEQNGIKHPRAGGLCAQAWALFDELGKSVDVKVALAEGYKRNLNDNNIRTELCRWRKFHGITATRTKKA